MLRFVLTVCALLVGGTVAARPMVIHDAQIIDAPAGYYYFGYTYAIEGDWAIVAAATPSGTPANPQQTHDALLYHRVNGQWTLDRVLVRREQTEYGQWLGFSSMAMNNGVAVIGANPIHMFRRTNDAWTEIPHPFTAPPDHPDFVGGQLIWDGRTLLVGSLRCSYFLPQSWGALISRLNADYTWTPIERLYSNDAGCAQSPAHWGLSGDTAVAGAWSDDYENSPDQLHIFRRNGTTWNETSAIDWGNGEGDVRGNEIFYSSNGPGGTLVYRNDDTQTVVDNIRQVSTSYRESGGGFEFAHTDENFFQSDGIYRKNAAGKYEHAAVMLPRGPYTLAGPAKVNGRRVVWEAWKFRTNANQAIAFFDLPATFTPSPVIATGFGNGATPFTAQAGTFAVTNLNGNHVYRQSSLTGDHRALLGNSDWIEQSIEADIKPTAFNGADRWVGLAARYQDASNYYYVTLRSSGMVALKAMRNGVFRTLAQKALPIVAGRNYHVSLQVFDSIIMVRIDGKEFIWSSEDDLIPRGRAALLGYRAAVDYDNVVVAQLGQRFIHDLPRSNCYGPLSNFSMWTSSSGAWNCDSSTGERIMQQTSTTGVARAVVGTPTDDQVITTRARLTTAGSGTDRWFGIAARYVDDNNYYYLTVRNSNTVSLRKLTNGAITTLGTATLTVTPNTWYTLRLDAVGNELRAFVNGTQILQATDTSHASGQGGLLTYKAAAEYVDYLAWQP
jgi:hypothetical protein